jgi:hypothetical protein
MSTAGQRIIKAAAAYYTRNVGRLCESFFLEARAINLEFDDCFLERGFGATECKSRKLSYHKTTVYINNYFKKNKTFSWDS